MFWTASKGMRCDMKQIMSSDKRWWNERAPAMAQCDGSGSKPCHLYSWAQILVVKVRIQVCECCWWTRVQFWGRKERKKLRHCSWLYQCILYRAEYKRMISRINHLRAEIWFGKQFASATTLQLRLHHFTSVSGTALSSNLQRALLATREQILWDGKKDPGRYSPRRRTWSRKQLPRQKCPLPVGLLAR